MINAQERALHLTGSVLTLHLCFYLIKFILLSYVFQLCWVEIYKFSTALSCTISLLFYHFKGKNNLNTY